MAASCRIEPGLGMTTMQALRIKQARSLRWYARGPGTSKREPASRRVHERKERSNRIPEAALAPARRHPGNLRGYRPSPLAELFGDPDAKAALLPGEVGDELARRSGFVPPYWVLGDNGSAVVGDRDDINALLPMPTSRSTRVRPASRVRSPSRSRFSPSHWKKPPSFVAEHPGNLPGRLFGCGDRRCPEKPDHLPKPGS